MCGYATVNNAQRRVTIRPGIDTLTANILVMFDALLHQKPNKQHASYPVKIISG